VTSPATFPGVRICRGLRNPDRAAGAGTAEGPAAIEATFAPPSKFGRTSTQRLRWPHLPHFTLVLNHGTGVSALQLDASIIA
jgi:hypothetical protein